MPEMTVASTTDTQADIDQAAGVVREEVKYRKSDDEQLDNAGETKSVEETEKEQSDQAKPAKSGFQKRIDKLTREKHERDGQIQQLNERLAKLEKGEKAAPAAEAKDEKEATAEVADDPEPTEEQFADYRQFVKAQARWEARQEFRDQLTKIEAKEAEKVALEQQQAEVKEFKGRLEEARERYDDFDEVIGRRNIQVPQVVVDTIPGLENGPDVMYYLAQHPDVCEKLMEMKPHRAVAEIGKIAAALEPKEDDEPSSTARGVSKAPAPIRPIGGSATKSSVQADQLPYQEFKKLRNAQIKNRYR